MVTREDRVLPDVQDLAGRWDHQDLLDYLDRLDRLEDPDLLVPLVLQAHLEYLVDMPASTSPSNLFVVVYFMIISVNSLIHKNVVKYFLHVLVTAYSIFKSWSLQIWKCDCGLV